MIFGSAGINHKFVIYSFEHELEKCNLKNTNEGKHVYAVENIYKQNNVETMQLIRKTHYITVN